MRRDRRGTGDRARRERHRRASGSATLSQRCHDLVDAQPRRAEDLGDLGGVRRRLGDHAGVRAGGDDLALGEHDHVVGHRRRRTRRRGWRPARRARRRRGPAGSRPARAWRRSRARGSARRAAAPAGWRRARWPGPARGAGPRRGRAGGGRRAMPGTSRSRRARQAPAAAVGGRALLGDRLEVEQVGGRLRDQPDERAAPGGVERGRVGAVDRDAAGAAPSACPAGPRAASTCRSRCGPSGR